MSCWSRTDRVPTSPLSKSQCSSPAHLADVLEVDEEDYLETMEDEGAGTGTEFAIFDFSEAEYLSVEESEPENSVRSILLSPERLRGQS